VLLTAFQHFPFSSVFVWQQLTFCWSHHKGSTSSILC